MCAKIIIYPIISEIDFEFRDLKMSDNNNIYSSSIKGKLKIRDNGQSKLKLSKEEAKEKKAKKKLKKAKKDIKKLDKLAKKARQKQIEDKQDFGKNNENLPESLREALGETRKDPFQHLSETQKKLMLKNEMSGKTTADLRKIAGMTHVDRVNQFNQKLKNQLDINDIPKCSWTK